MFVNGMTKYCFRSLIPEVGEERLSGHYREFFYSPLLWINVYGIIIRVDIILSGKLHDRRMYMNTELVQYADEYLSNDEAAMADSRYQGKGRNLIFLFKNDVCR